MGFLGIGDDPGKAAKDAAQIQSGTQLKIANIQAKSGLDTNLIQQEISLAANEVKREELKIQNDLGQGELDVKNRQVDVEELKIASMEKTKMLEILLNYKIGMKKADGDYLKDAAKARKTHVEADGLAIKNEAKAKGYNDGNSIGGGGFLSGTADSGGYTGSVNVGDPGRNSDPSVRG